MQVEDANAIALQLGKFIMHMLQILSDQILYADSKNTIKSEVLQFKHKAKPTTYK